MADEAAITDVNEALSRVELAERALEGRRYEAEAIREALRDAADGLTRALVGLKTLAAIERDEAREAAG